MDKLKKLLKNKNFQASIIVITIVLLVINFPFLLLFVTPLLIVAGVYDQHVQNKKAAKKS